jgi:hypothetical protein
MPKKTHEFDELRLWDSWKDSDIEKVISDETIATMQRIVNLLDDETKTEKTKVTRYNFILLVREMHELCKNGSRGLGEAIIKASEYEDKKEFEKAKKVYEDFLSSCKSKFYRDIARGQIKKLP